MSSNFPIPVEVVRGDFVESRHAVLAAVVDEDGDFVEGFGNLDQLVSPRSAIKKLQALSFVASDAIEKFKLTDKHISFSCASHIGEAVHINLAQEWMQALGLNKGSFVCGAHAPVSEKTKRELILKNEEPSSLHNNCSGKHLGILSTCLALGYDVKNYGHYDHPIQIRIRKVLSEVMEFDYSKVHWGVDGCDIPTYAVPLKNIALGMSKLITDKKISSDIFAKKSLQECSQKILNAVEKEPVYIAGSEELATRTAIATQGRLIIKVGAEGVYCGVDRKNGKAFAFKAVDGNVRAAEAAMIYWFRKNNLLSEDEEQNIKVIKPKLEIRSWAQTPAGRIQVAGLS